MQTEAGMGKDPSLTVGIPAGRGIGWSLRILVQLQKPDSDIQVLVARWRNDPFTAQELRYLNQFYPTGEVLSDDRHASAMRNSIIRQASSSHILFLDDDMVPSVDLLSSALRLAQKEPDIVHQGIPYRVANPYNWLAKTEGQLYKRGYESYIDSQDNVSLLDARLMLAPVLVLRQIPFDESLVFGGGEGRELAKSLMEKGVVLKLARNLGAAHLNRDTVRSVIEQKLAHGRGRGYQLIHDGSGEGGWASYVVKYTRRHFVDPAINTINGELTPGELAYTLGTNTLFWVGATGEMVRRLPFRFGR